MADDLIKTSKIIVYTFDKSFRFDLPGFTRKAYEISEQNKDKIGMAKSLNSQAGLKLRRGDIGKATADFRRAQSLQLASGSPYSFAIVFHDLGPTYQRLNDWSETLHWHQDAERMRLGLFRPITDITYF